MMSNVLWVTSSCAAKIAGVWMVYRVIWTQNGVADCSSDENGVDVMIGLMWWGEYAMRKGLVTTMMTFNFQLASINKCCLWRKIDKNGKKSWKNFIRRSRYKRFKFFPNQRNHEQINGLVAQSEEQWTSMRNSISIQRSRVRSPSGSSFLLVS